MAGEKKNSSSQITCRLSCSMRAKLDKLVEIGEFENVTDIVDSALHYYLNRYELRQDMLYQIIEEMDKKLDAKLEEKLYSVENEEFLYKISAKVGKRILEENHNNR